MRAYARSILLVLEALVMLGDLEHMLDKWRIFWSAILADDRTNGGGKFASNTIDYEAFIGSADDESNLRWAEFVVQMREFGANYSDFGLNMQPVKYAAYGDTLFVYYTMTVTNDTRPPTTLFPPNSVFLAPSGKTIKIETVDIVTFGEDGRIVSVTSITDRLKIIMGGAKA